MDTIAEWNMKHATYGSDDGRKQKVPTHETSEDERRERGVSGSGGGASVTPPGPLIVGTFFTCRQLKLTDWQQK